MTTPPPPPYPGAGHGPDDDLGADFPDDLGRDGRGPDAELAELRAMYHRLYGDHAALAARLRQVEDQVTDCAVVLDEISDALEEAARTAGGADDVVAAAAASEDGEDEGGLDLPRLVAWVRVNVADLLQRRIPQTGGYPYWCRSWWMHPEAVVRFEAARLSWEEAVAAGPGSALAVYFEHLDHQLAQLMADNGPFSGCTGGNHGDHSQAALLGQVTPPLSYYGGPDDPPPVEIR